MLLLLNNKSKENKKMTTRIEFGWGMQGGREEYLPWLIGHTSTEAKEVLRKMFGEWRIACYRYIPFDCYGNGVSIFSTDSEDQDKKTWVYSGDTRVTSHRPQIIISKILPTFEQLEKDPLWKEAEKRNRTYQHKDYSRYKYREFDKVANGRGKEFPITLGNLKRVVLSRVIYPMQRITGRASNSPSAWLGDERSYCWENGEQKISSKPTRITSVDELVATLFRNPNTKELCQVLFRKEDITKAELKTYIETYRLWSKSIKI